MITDWLVFIILKTRGKSFSIQEVNYIERSSTGIGGETAA